MRWDETRRADIKDFDQKRWDEARNFDKISMGRDETRWEERQGNEAENLFNRIFSK